MEITTKGTKMKQLTTSQATDTDEWLNERRGRITGTKAAGVAIENYQQIDVAHLLDMADKQETAATKARTSDKAAEYLAKADDYRAKAKDAETANKRLKLTADFGDSWRNYWPPSPPPRIQPSAVTCWRTRTPA